MNKQQIDWKEQLEHWIKTQHSTAGWQIKLENFIEKTLSHQNEEFTENVGFLRQWLNEDRIDDTKKMVSNEDIIRFLEMKN